MSEERQNVIHVQDEGRNLVVGEETRTIFCEAASRIFAVDAYGMTPLDGLPGE
jgi:hypothetical protein